MKIETHDTTLRVLATGGERAQNCSQLVPNTPRHENFVISLGTAIKDSNSHHPANMDSSRLELQRIEYNKELKRLNEALQARAKPKNKLRSLEMEQLELDLQLTALQNRSRRLSE